MAGPRFLYFDLGNVLLHFDHPRAARQMAELAGVPAERVWQVVFEADLEWRYERGELTSDAFCAAFAEATGSSPDQAALLRAASDIFALNHEILPLVAALRRGGHRLGILSNTNEAHWEFVNRGELAQVPRLFDLHLLSFRERAMKPEPEIYEIAARRAGVAPAEIFFVDDRPDNVAGALAAGWDALLYESPRQLAAALRQRSVHFDAAAKEA